MCDLMQSGLNMDRILSAEVLFKGQTDVKAMKSTQIVRKRCVSGAVGPSHEAFYVLNVD